MADKLNDKAQPVDSAPPSRLHFGRRFVAGYDATVDQHPTSRDWIALAREGHGQDPAQDGAQHHATVCPRCNGEGGTCMACGGFGWTCRDCAPQRGAQAAEQASGEESPARGHLPTVLFNGVPARSVVRLADGAILAEAPLPEGLPLVRIIDAWIEP